MKAVAVVAGIALFVAGCATEPEVLEIGNDSYSLTAHAQMGIASSRQEAVDDAKEFCGKQHKTAVISSFEDSGDWHGYTTSVIFTCSMPKPQPRAE